ncbi:choice-of-anchor D domain-containing protein [Capillimicrobium parvum]|uniref:Right handed beta helix domain-containing protein n=1 Tax=Capillimicrobium parvum TaxID=2884022 RepID=A0A9E7C2W0_9ACTN|nr:choice-of-anchor D domain-containing protein [Capillimicrobium parvum]UGS38911.1 hypothetical protein DSM104329_05342 [Capillimicrobium parvum]
MRRSRSIRVIPTLVLAVLAVAAAPAVAAPAERFVATTGDDAANTCAVEATPCRTIQHAVDVSDAANTINVAAGTYVESVVVGQELTIVGPFSNDFPDDPARGGAAEARWMGDGGSPAVTATVDGIAIAGFTFGPATGPASGQAVLIESGAHVNQVWYSIFEHLERGIELDGSGSAFVAFNLFQDNDAASGEAVQGFSDDQTFLFQNLFRRNSTAVDLDGSTNGQVQENWSTGDATFTRMRVTGSMGVVGNLVEGVTEAGILLAGDADADIELNSIDGDGDGLRLTPDGGTVVSDPIVDGNNLHDLGGSGIEVAAGALSDILDAHGNRIFGTGAAGLLVEGDADVDATNNWWGCNEGPNQPGCDDYSGANVDADPWSIMTISADPDSIPVGGDTSQITASFNTNSDGDDILPQGIGDDVQVAFSTTLGDVDPAEDCTCGGLSLTELTSGDLPGTATVTATLDSESVSTDVTFTGAHATVTPAGADFQPTQVGGYSTRRKFTVSSDGNETLQVSNVGIGGTDSGDFVIPAGYDGCTGRSLAPGDHCVVEARFQPVGGPGAKDGTLVVDTNAIDTPATATLTGSASASPVLTIVPDSADFGTVSVNALSRQQKLVVYNGSAGGVTIDAATLGGADPSQFEITLDRCTGETVAPRRTCYIRTRFAPKSGGAKAAGVEIGSSSLGAPATAALTGTGDAVEALRITPPAHAFGAVPVGQRTKTGTWTVKNIGGVPVTVSSVDIGGSDPDQFQLGRTTCTGAALSPGQSCTAKVRFAPTGDPGPRSAQLAVNSSVSGTPASALTGTAVAPPI